MPFSACPVKSFLLFNWGELCELESAQSGRARDDFQILPVIKQGTSGRFQRVRFYKSPINLEMIPKKYRPSFKWPMPSPWSCPTIPKALLRPQSVPSAAAHSDTSYPSSRYPRTAHNIGKKMFRNLLLKPKMSKNFCGRDPYVLSLKNRLFLLNDRRKNGEVVLLMDRFSFFSHPMGLTIAAWSTPQIIPHRTFTLYYSGNITPGFLNNGLKRPFRIVSILIG